MVSMTQWARRAALYIPLSALLALALAGCETTSMGKRIDYKSVSDAPRLDIPPELSTPRFDDRYTANTASGVAQQVANRPKTQELLPTNPDAHIARAGNERWLVVNATPQQAWLATKKFFESQGFVLAIEEPDLGVIETDWAENRAEIPNDPVRNLLGKYADVFYTSYKRDKFRARIEKGAEPGTTEIFISHRGMEQIPTAKIDNSSPAAFAWAPTPENPELEADMLSRLMMSFGTTEPQAQAAVAQAAAQPDKARIEKAKDGAPQLVIDDSFDHAWRRVGLALDRSGFTVVDRDRSKGLYYVRYANPEVDMSKKDAQEGFLSKLMFWKTDDKDLPENYRVRVAESAPQSLVSVQDANGTPDKTPIGGKILALLQDQLK
jgi:outer membrane protein assembly factor BamC